MNFNEIKELCYKTAQEQGYEVECPVRLNKRLKTTLGRFGYSRCGAEATPSFIEFNLILTNEDFSEEVARNVILHEMAHYLTFKSDGAGHGHDSVWKKWCVKIGARPERVENTSEWDKKTEACINHKLTPYRYQVVCSECGEVVGRYKVRGKVVKNIGAYRCAHCHGDLYVETI